MSRCEFPRLVVDVNVPGEKSRLVERIRPEFESNTFIAVRSSYVSVSKFGGKNDGYGGERSWWRFDTNMMMSDRIGHRRPNLLFGRGETANTLLDCRNDKRSKNSPRTRLLEEESLKFTTRNGLVRSTPECLPHLLTGYFVNVWPPLWVSERDLGTINRDLIFARG